ncbi:MAG: peptidylprolyl isomerase [Elusimicrobia bacterium]|nr:peptidylprolyl isomerase [Elusimicrobiota bacterium]
MKIYCLSIAFFGILFCACGKKNPPQAIAKVGEMYVTKPEFDRKIEGVAAQYQNYISTSNGRKQFLEILIREKLLLAAAHDSGIESNDGYKNEVARVVKENELRLAEFKDYLLTKLWIERISKEAVTAVSEREINDYYEKYPYEVSVSHILMGEPDNANVLLESLRGGKNFALAAKQFSIDAETSQQGGKVAPFIAGEFLPELESAAFSMKQDEVQGVFKSKFGYHIIKKLGERKPALAEVKDRIARILEKKKFDDYLKSLQEKYKPEILDEQYKYN